MTEPVAAALRLIPAWGSWANLLRADSLWVQTAAAPLAIGQKFVFRVGGKHV